MRFRNFLASCLAIPASSTVYAHGGGLDSEGCHHNRRTGDYHCHRGAVSPPPKQAFAPRAVDHVPARGLTPGDDSRPGNAFGNCDAARAAGAAPVRRGEAGYGAHLDRDGDGIGCER